MKMTIYDQIKETMAQHSSGDILTTRQIRQEVHARHGTNEGCVIPSDLCYNRINVGIDADSKNRLKLFLHIEQGLYKYVGTNYIYEGEVFARPKGNHTDETVGKIQDGNFIRYT